MNRRGLLGALAGLLGTAVLDPEALLWKPTKTIFIPPPPAISLRFLRTFDLGENKKFFNRLDLIAFRRDDD